MNERRIKWLLILASMVTTVVPLVAAFHFLDRSLRTSLDLGFNREIAETLASSSENLKTLKVLDAANEGKYRAEFAAAERLRLIYSDAAFLKQGILRSLRVYFGLGVLAAAALAMLVSTLVNRRISTSYQRTFEDLLRQKAKVRYLEEIGSWQELAKMLAHEIKNPLTPIEVLMSSLGKAYATKPPSQFAEHLEQTQGVVAEELAHLKRIVRKFSEFSKVPAVQLETIDIKEGLARLVVSLRPMFGTARIEVADAPLPQRAVVKLDLPLFRQVLANIVRNGVEASGETISFSIAVEVAPTLVVISVSNTGPPVPSDLKRRIFDPYVTGKSGQENMGLGLTIVRKIVLEHGGEISYTERLGHPVFVIALPRVD